MKIKTKKPFRRLKKLKQRTIETVDAISCESLDPGLHVELWVAILSRLAFQGMMAFVGTYSITFRYHLILRDAVNRWIK